ncbi:MAG: ParB N-terminal domain-containing protein [Richelia sp. RM1_1_1]|nr:ParB N-terminal domain-containing protein [Richelia sp. RM1_1_1]
MTIYTENKYLNPHYLAIHAELLRIYGKEHRADLQLDIAEKGIIVPLIVSTRTSENIVVSGGCRLRAAIALNIECVPVICYQFPSEEAEKHFILSANRNRPKTKYQRLLEGREWEFFENVAAALRRKKGLEQRWTNKDDGDYETDEYYPPTLLSDYRSGSCEPLQSTNKKQRATDKVASRIGMSRSSYERAKPVIEKCEKLRQQDKELEASALEEYLESSGISVAARLLKLADCDAVLGLVASGEARNVNSALTLISRINLRSAIALGVIFFFPDKMLRKSSHYHLGRVVGIANSTAIVCFRDDIDWELYEHQYKCDELLCLTRMEEEPQQQALRDRINYLMSHQNSTPIDRYVLNRLLRPVTSIDAEIEYLQIIEWRVDGVRDSLRLVA